MLMQVIVLAPQVTVSLDSIVLLVAAFIQLAAAYKQTS